MKKNRLGVCLVMAWLFVVTLSSAQESSKIKVTSLPDLPSIAEARTSFGFAGMVGEMHKDALITAGGANFPNGLPWEGGKKIYSDSIYLLIDGQWQIASEKLPTPLAYAASVSVPEGLPVMGGENGNTASSAVFLCTMMSLPKPYYKNLTLHFTKAWLIQRLWWWKVLYM